MKLRIILSIALALVALAATYAVGHLRGRLAILRQQNRFDVVYDLNLYRMVERGDTNALRNKLQFKLWCDVMNYDKYSGKAVETNHYFAKHLAEVRQIAAQEKVVNISLSSLAAQVNGSVQTNGSTR